MARLMQSLLISAAIATSPLLMSPTVIAANTTSNSAAATFSQQEIEQLIAPIALYPDALLAQVLMASTYPLEVVQAARWRKDNPTLKDKALENALQQQPWDASVKSLAVFPDVLQMMNEKIDWTQKLGDAFLAQQTDIMQASQRLRAKADAAGNLKTTQEQKVIVEAASGSTTTIYRIEPQSEIIYVPVYNPTIVYGTWPYPYYTPYYWYPPSYPYYGAAYGFTAGLIVGAALWGHCNWGSNDININVNHYNNFNRTSIDNGKWEHRPEHRKGVEYRDKSTRDQFRANNGNREAQRDNFRGKADASRGELNNVDHNALSKQVKNGEQKLDRAGQVDHAAARDKVGAVNRDHSGNTHDMGKMPSRDSSNYRAPRDNAFSNHSAQANRAASNRGINSQRSASRPPRAGGRR